MVPQRILFVDDEPVIRTLAQTVLTHAGYAVTTARDGHDALALFRSDPFPVVAIDLKMPGMDGIELLRQLKALSPRTDVIVVTAYPHYGIVSEALQAGATDYVLKPFALAALEGSVARCFEQQRLRRDAKRHQQ